MQEKWKGTGSYGTLGLEIALGILLPCYAGSVADDHYGTEDTFLILGFVLGLAHGARAVARALKQANREAEEAAGREKQQRKQYYDRRT